MHAQSLLDVVVTQLFWGRVCHGPVKTFGTEVHWRRRCIVNLPGNDDVADTNGFSKEQKLKSRSAWNFGVFKPRFRPMRDEKWWMYRQLGDLDPSNSGMCWQKQTAVGLDSNIPWSILIFRYHNSSCHMSCNWADSTFTQCRSQHFAFGLLSSLIHCFAVPPSTVSI